MTTSPQREGTRDAERDQGSRGTAAPSLWQSSLFGSSPVPARAKEEVDRDELYDFEGSPSSPGLFPRDPSGLTLSHDRRAETPVTSVGPLCDFDKAPRVRSMQLFGGCEPRTALRPDVQKSRRDGILASRT